MQASISVGKRSESDREKERLPKKDNNDKDINRIITKYILLFFSLTFFALLLLFSGFILLNKHNVDRNIDQNHY